LVKINERAIRKMLKQMKMEEIDADEVIIKTGDKELVIRNPRVSSFEVMGQRAFQIIGEVEERTGISEEDVQLVMEQAGVDRERAEKTLRECGGDIALAIAKLKGID